MRIVKGGIRCEGREERRARHRPPRVENRQRPGPVPVYVPPPPPEPEAEEPPPHPDDRNEEWIMSGDGHDQLYINAAMLERYRRDNDATTAVDYKEIAQQQCTRLEREGATKRSIEFVRHVFRLAAEKPNSNPIDFLL
mgnify:CR=1 FL=1